MHELLLEAMLANESLQTQYVRSLSDSVENAIEHLEALVQMPDGKMQ